MERHDDNDGTRYVLTSEHLMALLRLDGTLADVWSDPMTGAITLLARNNL
jgi:hypothetical protein